MAIWVNNQQHPSKSYAGSSLSLFLLLIAFIALCFHLKFMWFSSAFSPYPTLSWLLHKLCSVCYFYDVYSLKNAITSLLSFLSSFGFLVLSHSFDLLLFYFFFSTEVTCSIFSVGSARHMVSENPIAPWDVFSKFPVRLSVVQVVSPLLTSLSLWVPCIFCPLYLKRHIDGAPG